MEFEQTQSIVTRIRQILEEYKYGDTVLLELLQNSDDAAATKVEVALEMVPPAAVGAPDASALKPPALLFYNNSVFSERDLMNIQHIGGTEQSSKRSDGTKVGRFGIGFNSAFHLADVVSFATGSSIVCFDPSKEHLPTSKGRPIGGLRWDYLTHKCESPEEQQFLDALLTHFENCQLGFKRNKRFEGTIFRFALRRQPSKLWREVHPQEEVLQLITDFSACARLGMVLLKNVTSIRVSTRQLEEGPQAPLKPIFSVESSRDRGSTTTKDILSWLGSYTAVMQSVAATGSSINESDLVTAQKKLPQPLTIAGQVNVKLDMGSEHHVTRFTVHHMLGPGNGWEGSSSWKLAQEAARYHHPIAVPWSAAIIENEAPCDSGRLICFFPIRRATGLPVHLHGYFELSSDRQSIKDSLSSAWNRSMCTEVVPYAYTRAVVSLCAAKKPTYGLWPHGTFHEASLVTIAERTVSLLAEAKSIATKEGFSEAISTIFAVPLSITAHALVAECIPIASIVDRRDAAELKLLDKVFGTLRQHKIPITGAEPFMLRSALERCREERIPASVGEELLVKCTDDEDFEGFVDFSRELKVIPLHSGICGKLSSREDRLYYAKTAEVHALSVQFPFKQRLVRAYHDVDTPVGTTCRKRLDALCGIDALIQVTPLVIMEETSKRLSRPMLLFKRHPVEGGAASGSRPPAAANPLLDWRLQLASSSADQTVSWQALTAFWESTRSASEFAHLQLLPGTKTIPVGSDTGRQLFSVIDTVCVAIKAPEAVHVDPAADGAAAAAAPADDLRAIADALLELGAVEVDMGLLPGEVAASWKATNVKKTDTGSHPQLHVLDQEDSAPVVAAVLQRLLRASAAPGALHQQMASNPNIGPVLFRCLLRGLGKLTMEDLNMVATLPIFPNIWSTRVALKSSKNSTRKVMLVADNVPEEVLMTLRLLQPGGGPLDGYDLVSCVDFKAEIYGPAVGGTDANSDGSDPFFAEVKGIFNLLVVNLLTAKALAATQIPMPTSRPQGPDEERINSAWRDLVSGLAGLSSSKEGERPELLQRALSVLSKHPFLPTAHPPTHDGATEEDSRIAPAGGLDPQAVQGEIALLMIKLGTKTTKGVPRLPDLSFLAPLTQEDISKGLAQLDFSDVIDGPALEATIKAFATHNEELFPDVDSRCEIAGWLVNLLEMSSKLSAESWKGLLAMPFVPCTVPLVQCPSGTKIAPQCLMAPRDCTLPDNYVLCPVSWRASVSPYFLTAQKSRKGVHQCTNNFGWADQPPMKQVCEYLDWTANHTDRVVVGAVAEKVWDTYAYLEKLVVQAGGASAEIPEVKNFRFLYIPGRNVSVAVAHLSMDPQAQKVEPYLSCVDRTMAATFPVLISALKIPEKHKPETILGVLTQILQTEAPPPTRAPKKGEAMSDLYTGSTISDNGRVAYAAALEYLMAVTPEENMSELGKSVLVPTSDGKLFHAERVAYDFFNTEDASNGGASDILHSCVNAKVARALGMNHTGKRFLKDRKPQYSQAFRARGQRQSLTNAIKRILSDYSDTQSILMEMLQNADDAGADEVCFYMDMREFAKDVEGLLGAGMARCQGPALVVTNNKLFTKSDFDALMEIGSGHKKNDNLSIGRFGLGFNSVYHMTDCPSIVSGNNVVFLDPTASHVSYASPDAPGLMIDHTAEPQLQRHFPAQFTPYELYGVKLGQDFRSTLFRLPIRTEPNETLCERTWLLTEVRKLFHDFSQRMDHLLLFLKNVLKVRLMEIDPQGTVREIRTCSFANASAVSDYRMNLTTYIAVQHPEKTPSPPLRMSEVFTVVLQSPRETIREHWRISTSLHSQFDEDVPTEGIPKELKQKLLPWATVAAKIDNHDNLVPASDTVMSCFLPMPVRTNLPFHVHGCFALSSDRRGMWVDSLGSEESWEVKWNKFVLGSIAPEAVARMLQTQPPLPKQPAALQQFYSCWPVPQVGVTEIVAMMGNGLFQLLVQDDDAAVLWSTVQQHFVAYNRACLEPNQASAPMRLKKSDDSKKVRKTLSSDVVQIVLHDEKLCSVPQAIYDAFVKATEALELDPPDELSPAKLCRVLNARIRAATTRNVPFAALFPSFPPEPEHFSQRPPFMADIATFCLSDTSREPVGLPLLFLQDHSVGIINKSKHLFVHPDSGRVAEALFPQTKSAVVDPTFLRQLSNRNTTDLPDILDYCNVAKIKVENISQLLAMYATDNIPAEHIGEVFLWNDPNPRSPLARFLVDFWNFMYQHTSRLDADKLADCGDLAEWPLIPARRGGERALVPIRDRLSVASGASDPTVAEAFLHLGVWVLDTEFPECRAVRSVCGIADVEGENLGELLKSARDSAKFEHLDDEQRPQFLRWLLRVNDQNRGMLSKLGGFFGRKSAAGPGPLNDVIRSLPLFETYDAAEGRFKWSEAPTTAVALPKHVPMSVLCDGYYREPCDEIGLKAVSQEDFFVKTVLPALDNGNESGLSVEEFVNHIRLIGAEPALTRACSVPLRDVRFIPSQTGSSSMRPRRTLRDVLVNYVAQHQIEHRPKLKSRPHLIEAIRNDEISRLDHVVRYMPTECVRPLICPEAAIPNVISILLDGSESAVHMVPAILWEDPHCRTVLQAAGVKEKVSPAVISSAAQSIKSITRTRDLLRAFVERNIFDGYDFVPAADVRSSRRARNNKTAVVFSAVGGSNLGRVKEYFYQLGVSLCQVAMAMGEKEALDELNTLEFVSAYLPEGSSLPGMFNASSTKTVSMDDIPLFAPQEMLRFDERLLAWTQRPLMDPILTEWKSEPIPVSDIITHLSTVLFSQKTMKTSLVDNTLDACYGYLTGKAATEAAKAELLTTLQVFTAPRQEGDAIVKATTLARIIHAPGIGSCAPFFYQATDLHPLAARLASNVQVLTLPKVELIIEVLCKAAMVVRSASPEEAEGMRSMYIELLRLLVQAADAQKVNLNYPEGDNYQSVMHCYVPTQDGNLTPIRQANIADAPALLRRIRKGSLALVHPMVPFDVCVALGVPSTYRSVVERPSKHVALPDPPALQRNINLLLPSPVFARAIHRIIASEVSHKTRTKDTKRPRIERLAAMRVEVVSDITVTIHDTRVPHAPDISTQTTAPISCTDRKTNRIFIKGNASSVEPHFLLATEINKLLNNAIGNLAPLCSILQLVASNGPDAISSVHEQLDVFGCADISSGGNVAFAGALMDDDTLACHAVCPIPSRGQCWLPNTTPRLVANVDKDTSLVKWVRPDQRLNPSLSQGRLVVAPEFLC